MTRTTSRAAWALRTRTVLFTTTFVVLWEKLGLGTLPRALFVPSPGATRAERARIEHLAATELSRLGLGAGEAADHELAAALRLLATPELEIYGWLVPATGRAFAVHAASSGRSAVLAIVDTPIVDLRPVDPEDLAVAVTHQLPAVPPAAAPTALTEYSRAAFEHATGTTITGNGQLFVAVRDKLGRRQHEYAVEYVDTTKGRWLPRRTPLSAKPGTRDAITTELDAAHLRITARRSHG